MNALFIGRFQPFHMGHLLVIQQLSKYYDMVIIGIGSSEDRNTKENPFSEQERTDMITKSLDEKKIKNYRIVSIPDIHDPPHWVAHVCSLVTDFDVVITNNPFTKQLFTEKGYLVKTIRRFKPTLYSGTEIRRRILTNKSWETLVPEPVKHIIKDVQGVTRIQKISS